MAVPQDLHAPSGDRFGDLRLLCFAAHDRVQNRGLAVGVPQTSHLLGKLGFAFELLGERPRLGFDRRGPVKLPNKNGIPAFARVL
jgi:hypothetical protein